MPRKSFRYWTKENFDTSPRYESLVITELRHFLWDPFILTHEKKVKNCQKLDVQKVGFHKKGHISEIMSPTDLRQVSKFSLVQYLIPWASMLHLKILPQQYTCSYKTVEQKWVMFPCQISSNLMRLTAVENKPRKTKQNL